MFRIPDAQHRLEARELLVSNKRWSMYGTIISITVLPLASPFLAYSCASSLQKIGLANK